MCVRRRGKGKSFQFPRFRTPLERNTGILNRKNSLKGDPIGDESKEIEQWAVPIVANNGAFEAPVNLQPQEVMLSTRGCPDEEGSCPRRRNFVHSPTKTPDGEKGHTFYLVVFNLLRDVKYCMSAKTVGCCQLGKKKKRRMGMQGGGERN